MSKNTILWIAAIILMILAVFYQRATGPTKPYTGSISVDNQNFRYKLDRSHSTSSGAVISLPNNNIKDFSTVLHYKRYKTNDSITSAPMLLKTAKARSLFGKAKTIKQFEAELPVQASAGKMSYFITGKIGEKSFRIPEDKQENIVLRYKDDVPLWILLPHIFFMFFSVIFGMRAGLSAIFDPKTMRKWAVTALIGMTIGGMMLGPIVQKYAFGEYWTGYPYGKDFTDNKMLIMWLVWLIAVLIVGFKKTKKENTKRIVVVLAAIVMTITYLIPHSMGGSTLDYSKVDQGINPKEAIKTGAE